MPTATTIVGKRPEPGPDRFGPHPMRAGAVKPAPRRSAGSDPYTARPAAPLKNLENFFSRSIFALIFALLSTENADGKGNGKGV
jgi:hypothetical protein